MKFLCDHETITKNGKPLYRSKTEEPDSRLARYAKNAMT